jgi:hypothetical protein
MTYKLIKTTDYILVVDDSEIKVGDNCLCDIPASDYFGVVAYNGAFAEHYYKKIIAHLPLNDSPILEDVDLLPPYSRHQEDGLEEYGESCNQLYKEWLVTGYKSGYNKAREKYKYTEEDMRKAIDMAHEKVMTVIGNAKKYSPKEIIQSFHQYPTEFECEMKYFEVDMGLGEECIEHGQIPQKITTAQGVQWVGKYK